MDSPVSIDQVTQSLTSSRAPQMDRLKGASDEQVRKTAEEFEGFFVSMMLESMFAGIKTDTMFGGGQGEAVFRSMLLQEYGKSISQSDGFGIADTVQREILKLQEVQNS